MRRSCRSKRLTIVSISSALPFTNHLCFSNGIRVSGSISEGRGLSQPAHPIAPRNFVLR